MVTSIGRCEELEYFLFLVFSGNEPEMVQDVKTKRFVCSVGLDICREVSLEKWKLEETHFDMHNPTSSLSQ